MIKTASISLAAATAYVGVEQNNHNMPSLSSARAYWSEMPATFWGIREF